MSFKIFYAWQSDTPKGHNDVIIKLAIKKALEEIYSDINTHGGIEASPRPPTLDHDTKDVSGSPNIIQTILRKIDACDIFIGDVTFVGRTYIPESDAESESKSPTPTSRPQEKESWKKVKYLPNPNVVYELGYAMASKGPSRVIMVMNEAYGSRDEQIFDLAQHRHPICYSLASNNRNQKRKARHELANRLKNAILGCLKEPKPSLPHNITIEFYDEAQDSLSQFLSLRPFEQPFEIENPINDDAIHQFQVKYEDLLTPKEVEDEFSTYNRRISWLHQNKDEIQTKIHALQSSRRITFAVYNCGREPALDPSVQIYFNDDVFAWDEEDRISFTTDTKLPQNPFIILQEKAVKERERRRKHKERQEQMRRNQKQSWPLSKDYLRQENLLKVVPSFASNPLLEPIFPSGFIDAIVQPEDNSTGTITYDPKRHSASFWRDKVKHAGHFRCHHGCLNLCLKGTQDTQIEYEIVCDNVPEPIKGKLLIRADPGASVYDPRKRKPEH